MSRREDLPVVRKHVVLYQEDWDFFVSMFSDKNMVSRAIRTIMHDWKKKMEVKQAASAQSATSLTQTLTLEDLHDGNPEPALGSKAEQPG